MTKDVTSTTVKVAQMIVEKGVPVAKPLDDIILLGNVDLEKAQKYVVKNFGAGVTVFEVVADTVTYEMPVEEFIQIAKIKELKEDVTEVDGDTEEEIIKG
jgi:hypothetical protein